MKAYRQVKTYTFADGTQLLEEFGKLPQQSEADELLRLGSDERLVDIAYRAYGDHEEWYGLAYANGIIDPWDLPSNTQLIIPA